MNPGLDAVRANGPGRPDYCNDFSGAFACINTMRAQNVTLKDSLPGFIVAENGGVVRLAELQSQGCSYLRP